MRADDADDREGRDDKPAGGLLKEVIDFEQHRWKYLGAKEAAVREQFGFSLTHYYVVLEQALADPEVEAYAPSTVYRLRRLREVRRQARSATRDR